MRPILYPENEILYNNNGIGVLADAISCLVTEERNGRFELEMQYPMEGVHYGHLADRAIVLAKPNPTGRPQPFRIYRITRPLNGIVTLYARHVSYDLSGKPVQPFSAVSAPEALTQLKVSAVAEHPFTFQTDKTTAAVMNVRVPASTRSLLGGTAGSVLDIYGGEWEFDRFVCRLHDRRGANRGVSIRYGKNLTSLEQERSIASVSTGVYPYWASPDGTQLVQLPERVVNAPGSFGFTQIRTLDLSAEWAEAPTEEQLRSRAQAYIKTNNIGKPAVNLRIGFVQLEQTEEYRHLALLEQVRLCDTVNVSFPRLGVESTAKCIKMVYNVLRGRVESIELGDARTDLADTIVSQQNALTAAKGEWAQRQAAAIEQATGWLTGANGYVIAVRDESGAWVEQLFLDTNDQTTAKNVLRINANGIGFSTNGINGPYEYSFVAGGKLNVSAVVAALLDADKVVVNELEATAITAQSTALGKNAVNLSDAVWQTVTLADGSTASVLTKEG